MHDCNVFSLCIRIGTGISFMLGHHVKFELLYLEYHVKPNKPNRRSTSFFLQKKVHHSIHNNNNIIFTEYNKYIIIWLIIFSWSKMVDLKQIIKAETKGE